jgi:hypothetical protein
VNAPRMTILEQRTQRLHHQDHADTSNRLTKSARDCSTWSPRWPAACSSTRISPTAAGSRHRLATDRTDNKTASRGPQTGAHLTERNQDDPEVQEITRRRWGSSGSKPLRRRGFSAYVPARRTR